MTTKFVVFREGFGASLPGAGIGLGGRMSRVVLIELATLDKSASAFGPRALEGEVSLMDHHVSG